MDFTLPARIEDYRRRYALYKSDPDLIAAHRSAPFVVSWDDHEVENNYAGDNDENAANAEALGEIVRAYVADPLNSPPPIFMGKDYELAVYSKDDFVWDKKDLLVPLPADAASPKSLGTRR